MKSLKNTSYSRYFDYGLDLKDFLYDPDIVLKIRRERIRLPNPTNYSQFFVLESENMRYQYGSIFEPHSDEPDQGEARHTHQFCFWHKDCVFFHIVKDKIVFVKPTLDPIEFDFRKSHGFVFRWHLKMVEATVNLARRKPPKTKISKILRNLEKNRQEVWWLRRLEYYQNRLLFIGKFI